MPRITSRRVAVVASVSALVTGGVYVLSPSLSSDAVDATNATTSFARNAAPAHRAPAATDSVSEDPKRLVSQAAPEAGDTTRMRIVTVHTDASGDAAVQVQLVRGRDEAVDTIAEAQADRGTLAVTVDTPVELIEPDVETNLAAANSQTMVEAAGVPYSFNDKQWSLTQLGATKVWGVADGAGATVAVLDTGVAGNHPDLVGQVLPGRSFVGSTGANGSGNGWGDGHGHGTHVAGIVAANGSNKIGISGLAPAAKILPVKVMSDDGTGWSSDIAEGIIWATSQGADVINLSLGGSRDSATEAAVNYALSKNVIVVAAAGNEYLEGNPITFPAALPGVIGVGATNRDKSVAWFSNRGAYVAVTAPGGNIYSTLPGGKYGNKSGTSMATPMVAAVAALAVDATDGDLTPAAFTNQVQNTAMDLGVPGRDTAYGYGLVQPYATVCAVSFVCGGGSQPVPPVDDDSPTVEQPPADATEPARTPVSVQFAGGDTYVHVGNKRTLKVRVTDYAGRPVAGHRVTYRRFVGNKQRNTASRVTGKNGYARLKVSPSRTSRYRVTAPGTTTSLKAVSGWDVRVRVVPKITKVLVNSAQVQVRVNRPRKQNVVLQRRVGGSWKRVSKRRLPGNNASGSVRLPNRGHGTYRVKVQSKGGVRAAVSQGWVQ